MLDIMKILTFLYTDLDNDHNITTKYCVPFHESSYLALPIKYSVTPTSQINGRENSELE
jgi:hypothetical protein